MTPEEKLIILNEKLQDVNVLRFVMKSVVSTVTPNLTETQLDDYLSLITTYQNTLSYRIEDAMNFASKLMVQFTTENIIMGITQDGMTGHVRKTLSEVTMCLITGSLYDAIYEVKSIPAEKRDVKYLSDARLLIFINKIETYLGVTLSTSSVL